MDDKRWWDIISVGCPRDVEPAKWHETLYAVLLKLDPDNIIRFDAWHDDRVCDAFRDDIWRAADLINGACSYAGFDYFRHWLVGMGKVVYEAALRSPDTLAEVVDPACKYEATSDGVCCNAWTELTGRTDDEYWDRYMAISPEKHLFLITANWPETEVALRRHFPRLSAMYLTNEAP